MSLAKLAESIIEDERQIAELRRMISDLGDQQLDNALRSLDNARISGDPSRELGSAINHLEDALSHYRQAYRNTDYSRWEKIRAVLKSDYATYNELDDNHPHYKAGKRICNALAIIATIYAALGERKLVLKYAEELRNDADKAYPSVFRIEAIVSPPNFPGLAPDRDLACWFFTNSSRSLEDAFSFFEAVNSFLKQVGANPLTVPQLTVHVRRFDRDVWNDKGEPMPKYHKWKLAVSSRRDLVMQYRKAVPRG